MSFIKIIFDKKRLADGRRKAEPVKRVEYGKALKETAKKVMGK